jgi:hypothetical protein
MKSQVLRDTADISNFLQAGVHFLVAEDRYNPVAGNQLVYPGNKPCHPPFIIAVLFAKIFCQCRLLNAYSETKRQETRDNNDQRVQNTIHAEAYSRQYH